MKKSLFFLLLVVLSTVKTSAQERDVIYSLNHPVITYDGNNVVFSTTFPQGISEGIANVYLFRDTNEVPILYSTNKKVKPGSTENFVVKNVPSGFYFVRAAVVVGNTYFFSSANHVALNLSSSVKDLSAEKIHLYPNPATDFITIIGENGISGDYDLSVINASGQKVLSVPQGAERIDVALLPKGVYFLTFGNAERGVRFLKE